MKRLTLITTLFFLSICTAFTQQSTIKIPLDLSTNRPIIEVKVNGKGPYRFIYDTGSGTNVIDGALAEELGLKLVGVDSLRSQGDSRLVSKRYEAEAISIEGTSLSKKSTLNAVSIRQMVQVDGIIGNGFTEDYMVTLDYPQSQLVLEKAELQADDEGVIPFLQLPRIVNLNISVDGNITEAHLDTGNPNSFSLPYALKDKLKFKEPLQKGGQIRTPVATYQSWHGQLEGDIMVGNVRFEGPNVVLVEGFEQANIGYRVIKDLVVSIDRKNNLIRFAKTAAKAKVEAAGDGTTNQFTGDYEGDRKVYLENGEMYLKRNNFVLKLEQLEGDLYKMVYHVPVNNELPNVRFDKDAGGKVIGLTFIFESGREDKVKKK